MGEEQPVVVGLGASAGGVQALRTFFEHVPPDSGMCFVAILHMSPDHESQLVQILQSVAKVPVTNVTTRTQVEPNHVYVVSPGQSLSMADGHIDVSDNSRFEERRAPIDIFFRTLADSYGTRSACVVLSGTGSDGSMGLKRVKERGGICLVQEPSEAEYADMPRNALATGLADAAMPVRDMPERLIAYRDGIARIDLQEEPEKKAVLDEGALQDLFRELRLRTGHDLGNYKRATVLRRIARRMGVRQLDSLANYVALVREQPDESKALLRDLLISVTNFFRDSDAFLALEREVIPRLFADKREDSQVRVWVPACATGEEAYSIAMLLAEHAAKLPAPPSIQMFATDLDDLALATAREGIYTVNDAADVAPERLGRFFVRDGDRYMVRKELREMVLFARHNLIKDPPFSHLDLVSCRNLLIYLNRTAQHRVLEVFHFALEPGGYLFLGSSETIEGSGDLFVTVNKDAHLFQSRGVAGRIPLQLPIGEPDAIVKRRSAEAPTEGGLRDRLAAPEIHQRLLERYAPPSVVVNAEHEIIHLSDGAAKFMHVSGGEPSLSVLKAVRPELRMELTTALYQAAQHQSNVESRGLIVQLDGGPVSVNLSVRPVTSATDPARGFFLVLFEETGAAAGNQPRPAPADLLITDPARQLEEEVSRLKTQLRSTVEQYETQTEELKASNEELQAINEEMRSTTEELETSKEELQSLNEELRTVNQELKGKVDEQTEASNNVQNLINSTDIGTLFLDRASRIKLFTPRMRDVFNLIPNDRGRALADISNSLVGVDVAADIASVLQRLERLEREVVTTSGRWYLMRVTPYRTNDERIDGVVITFVEITERKQAAEQLRQSEERLRKALGVETLGVMFFEMDGRITDTNEAFFRLSGHVDDDVTAGRLRWHDLTRPDSRRQWLEILEELRSTGRTVPREVEFVRPDGARWSALAAATRLSDNEGVCFLIDISDRHRAIRALREGDRRKNEFLATLAHELRNPLAPISISLELMRQTGGSGEVAEKARQTMERQVRHMVRLVDDLIEVSRITLGKIELRREPVDLGDIVKAAVEASMPALQAGGYDLKTTYTLEAMPTYADPVRLGQVVGNLLSNALKYTPPGGAVEVTTCREDAWARVSVRDNGVGITERLLPHVFDLFVQGAEAPKANGQSGLGVGLALVRTLVEGHGGRVQVHSDGPGKGTEFIVDLPLTPDIGISEAPALASDQVALTDRHIIVVDDNRDAADSLGLLLSMYGAEVEVVYNGADALDAFARKVPSVMFIDIGMPEMDGLELARRIRSKQEGGGVPLIAVTGWGQDQDRQSAFDAGFNHHLTKPPELTRLQALLSAIADA